MIRTVEFHPRLMEASVEAAMRRARADPRPAGAPAAMDTGPDAFDAARTRIYETPEGEARESDFASFYAGWFARLGLDRPVRAALGESAGALRAAGRCLVWPAAGERQAGAELFVSAEGDRTIVFALRPATLADGEATREFMRREVVHLSDMLDPEFRYEPHLPPHAAGPAHDRLMQDRYRVLWATSIEGRLARRSHSSPGARDRRLHEFGHLFACLGERLQACFERIFDGARPSHPELVALARDPEPGFGLRSGETAEGAAHRCTLCGFPTTCFEPAPGELATAARRALLDDFPAWTPARGICLQCADLYRARAGATTASQSRTDL